MKQCLEIDDRDAVQRANGGKGPRAIRRHLNASRTTANVDPLDLLTCRGVHHDHLGTAEIGDQGVLAIRGELQPVRTPEPDVHGLGHLLRDVDDRDTAPLCVRHPQLPAVRRQIESFGAGTDGHNGDTPIGCGRRVPRHDRLPLERPPPAEAWPEVGRPRLATVNCSKMLTVADETFVVKRVF